MMTNCGSSRPSGAEVVDRGAMTRMATTSSPVRYRTTSTSCTTESSMSISEEKFGGVVAFRCAQCRNSGAPYSPEAMSARNCW